MALVKFDIPMRSRKCSRGEEEFTQGMSYVSVLEEGEGEGFDRKDYCLSCWEKMIEDPETVSFGKVHWKSSVPIKKQLSEAAKRRDERAMELLKELYDKEDEAAEVFVLALLLVRLKKLQQKEEIVDEDGQVMILYEVNDTEEMIPIKKIDLSSIQTEKIQHTLSQKLSGVESE